MLPTDYGRWRGLVFTIAIIIAPAIEDAAGASPVAGQSQTPSSQSAQEKAQAPSTPERPADDTGTQATTATQSTPPPPTSSFSPVWRLFSIRDTDFRLRPNAGLRLRTVFRSYPPFVPSDPGSAPTNPWSIKSSLTALAVDRVRQSAKFQEYRDVRDGASAGIEARFRDDTQALDIVGRHLGLRDQDLTIEGGQAGKYLLALGYEQIPHNYSFNSRSLYDGIGTNQLTISDRIQTDLQASATSQEAADKIRAYQEQSAQTVEVGLLRKKVGLDFTLLSLYPFTIRAAASDESREGVRPSMGAFGLGNFEELPWPVISSTRDVRMTFEYAKPESRLAASGTYRLSLFDDHFSSLLFDNPYRIADTSLGSVGATYAAGPASGRIAMPPSNGYQEASVTSVLSRLPRQTSLSGLFSLGFLRQNEPLLPYSTNRSVVPGGANNPPFNATDLASLPRATAEASMDTAMAQVRLTTQPAKRLRLVVQYRFFNLANNETPFTIPAFVRADADIRRPATTGGTFAAVLAAYSRQTASAEGSLDFTNNTRLTLGYTFERMNRDFREVAWMNDNRVKVSFDTRPAARLDLKASYEHSVRNTSDYIFNQYNVAQGNALESPMMPFLRKYDEAARKRDEVQVIATAQVTDSLVLSGMALYGRDDFWKSPFGLLKDNHRVYSMDASYVLTEWLSLYASYSFERYFSLQKARQWSPTGVSNPYTRETGFDSNSNWDARPRDDIDTASAGLEGNLIPDRLRFNVAYTLSKTNGSIAFASPLGVAANDANAFEPAPFPRVDDVRCASLNPELEYRIGEKLSLSTGYQFEKYTISDINYEGFTYTPRNLTGGLNAGLLMGSYLFPSYNVNVFYVRVRIGF